ncbi:MAG: hypothetical protein QJR08_01305 [Bacillota bacterium]|nr:hypothetical protein [Bacillota bacterium]
MPWLFVMFTAVLLMLLLLADHVKNRFQHTPSSRRTLAAEGVLVAAASGLLAWRLLPRAPAWQPVALTVVVALPAYVLTAYVTVEVWRHRKQGSFDRHIRRLQREIDRLEEEIERLTWQLAELQRRRQRLRDEEAQAAVREQVLRDQVEAWVAARDSGSRSSAVLEWEIAYRAMSPVERAAERERIQQALRAARDGEERAERAAQLNLLTLAEVLAPDGQGSALHGVEQEIQFCRNARENAQRRLEQLEGELRGWLERRHAFLRERIPLD